jgi:hypothetical protein
MVNQECQKELEDIIMFPIINFISWLPNILDWYSAQKIVCTDVGSTARAILYSIALANQSKISNEELLAGMLCFTDRLGNRECLLTCLKQIGFNDKKFQIVLDYLDSKEDNHLAQLVKQIELVSPTYLGSCFVFNQDFKLDNWWMTSWQEKIYEHLKYLEHNQTMSHNGLLSLMVIESFHGNYGLGKTGGEHHETAIKNWLKFITAGNNLDLIDSAIKKLWQLDEPIKTAWYNSFYLARQLSIQQLKIISSMIEVKTKNNLPTDLGLLGDSLVNYYL